MSDTLCAVCEKRIVCSGDGSQWWHWPDLATNPGSGLDQHANDPYPHRAAPAEADDRS